MDSVMEINLRMLAKISESRTLWRYCSFLHSYVSEGQVQEKRGVRLDRNMYTDRKRRPRSQITFICQRQAL